MALTFKEFKKATKPFFRDITVSDEAWLHFYHYIAQRAASNSGPFKLPEGGIPDRVARAMDETEQRVNDLWKECASCGRTVRGTKVCSRCKRVRYCSKDCQRRHWREHRVHCGGS